MPDVIYVKPYFPPAGALKTPIRHLADNSFSSKIIPPYRRKINKRLQIPLSPTCFCTNLYPKPSLCIQSNFL